MVDVLVSDAAVNAMVDSIREQGAICPRSTTNGDLLIMGGWAVNIRKALRLAMQAQMTPAEPPAPRPRRPTDTVRKQPKRKP